MFVENLCSPAVLYLGFALTQILIDFFRKMYNVALVKSAVAVVFTTVLNLLCRRGLTTISWFIVFIPFVTMTFVTAVLLYVFGLGPFTGKMNYAASTPSKPANPNQMTRNPSPQQAVSSPSSGPATAQAPSSSASTGKQTDAGAQSNSTKTAASTTSNGTSTPATTTATTSGEDAIRGATSRVGSIVGGVGQGLGDVVGGLGAGLSDIASGIAGAFQ